MAKYYAYQKSTSPVFGGDSETLCPTCYKKRWAGIGVPSALGRGVLGYRPLTRHAQVRGQMCTTCRRPLLVEGRP